jgi:aryl-alcohol dehydrogenase-like predicted oxidoreductase
MQQTKLGATDLEVSRICLGTWQLGGDWGAIERDDAVAAVRKARELGINFFDSAQAYGWGESERMLGEALRGELEKNRDAVVIATKGGLRRSGDGVVRDSSRDWLRKGVDESLRNLGVDHIDVYQVHWPDPDVPIEESASALDELVREGKLRHVGVSNYSPAEMEQFERRRKLDTDQPPYHLFRRDVERDVLPWCHEHDVGVLVYGPLGHGLLTGKFDEHTTFPDDDWRSGSDLFRGDAFRRNLHTVRELGRLAGEVDITVAQLAIAWTLANPAVHCAIVGARNPGQLEQTAPAGDIALGAEDLDRIEDVMRGAVAVGGPSPEARRLQT